jgi:hypothetical protein
MSQNGTPLSALDRARLELVRAQLIAQIGSEEDFERVVEAQVKALREARAENKRKLAEIDEQLCLT